MEFIQEGIENLQIAQNPQITVRDLPGDIEELITQRIDEDTRRFRLNPFQINLLRDEVTDLRSDLRQNEQRYFNLERRFHQTTEEEREFMRGFEGKEQELKKINIKINEARTALYYRNLRVQAGIRF
tara:strand:+ start:515 stop:895 length:381 start_codon:yes stop_codon:yes gene_type:complete